MRYIPQVNRDELTELISRFCININLKQEEDWNEEDTEEQPVRLLGQSEMTETASFVFDSCKHLLPEDINADLFDRICNQIDLKQDLCSHLIVAGLLSNKYNVSPVDFKDNLRAIEGFMNIMEMGMDKDNGPKQVKEMTTYKNILDQQVAEYLKLIREEKRSIKTNKLQMHTCVRVFFFPFIFYMIFNYRLVKAVSENNFRNSEEIFDAVDHFQLIFDKYNDQLDDPDSGYFNSTYEFIHMDENTFDEFVLLNSVLFEREFNFQLITTIAKHVKELQSLINEEDVMIRINKTMSLLCLLPNVTTRREYARIISDISKDISLQHNQKLALLEDMQDILLHLSLITIPMMEKLFCYIVRHFEILPDTNDIHFNTLLPKQAIELDLLKSINELIQKTTGITEDVNIFTLLDNDDDYIKAHIDAVNAKFASDDQDAKYAEFMKYYQSYPVVRNKLVENRLIKARLGL